MSVALPPLVVLGVGAFAPGMANWAQARAVLRGEQAWQPQALRPPPPQRLPANERRRAGTTIRLVFAAAEDALADSGLDPAEALAVFAAPDSDLVISDRLCRQLAAGDRALSPTHFHNSVHNAPAGYWSIATGARGAYTSIAAGEATAGAALLEAAMVALDEDAPVLMVVHEEQAPEPLLRANPVRWPCAFALLLAPQGAGPRLQLACGPELGGEPCALPDALSALHQDNAAAQLLPLLAALARGEGRAALATTGDALLLAEVAS